MLEMFWYKTVNPCSFISLNSSPSEWDKNPEKVMGSFVSGMKEAYALAQDYGLEVIVCIPWYYDDKGQQKGLNRAGQLEIFSPAAGLHSPFQYLL